MGCVISQKLKLVFMSVFQGSHLKSPFARCWAELQDSAIVSVCLIISMVRMARSSPAPEAVNPISGKCQLGEKSLLQWETWALEEFPSTIVQTNFSLNW